MKQNYKIKFKFKKTLKEFNWKLFLSLFVVTLIPSIYKLIRIFIIGTLEEENIYSISSQLMWINLIYEILQEFLIVPIFYILAFKNTIDNKTINLSNKLRTGLFIIFSVYLLFFIILFIFANNICYLMNVSPNIIDQTVEYVRWESFAFLFLIIFTYSVAFLEFIEKNKFLYLITFLNLFLFIFMDLFLLSNFRFSANLGVKGIPISNIIVNSIMFIVTIIILWFENIKIIGKLNFDWVKEWLKKGSLTGLESFIRNIVFMLMIIRIANMVTEEGVYWIANNFIWQWLLLPTLTLSKLVQIELSNSKEDIKIKSIGYFFISVLFAITWLITIPLWPIFIKYALNYKNFNIVFKICLIQTPFYLTFIFNNIMDSTFIAKGKINYIIVQSIIINIIYYSIAFILFQTKKIQSNIYSLSLLFGIGMALDIIPTSIQYWILMKKINKTWIYKTFFYKYEIKLENGRSTPNVTKFGYKLYRPYKSENKISNQFLIFLENENFLYSQKYLGKDNRNRCVFSYVKGFVPKEIGNTTLDQLLKFIEIVKEFHKKSKKFKNNNHVWCHGDLSPCNTVFDENENPISIIDWDGLSMKNRLNDICYVLWLWINIGDPNKSNNIKIYELSIAIRKWELSNKELKNLKISFLKRMQFVIDNMNKKNIQYKKTSEWVIYSKKWINKNWKKIYEKII